MTSMWDAAALTLLAISGLLYLTGAIRRRARGAVYRRWEPLAFALGWSALVTAVAPPIDIMATQLFSIHMVQHELIMLIGAPLLIAGRPLPVILDGMSPGMRSATVALLQGRPGAAAWRTATNPAVAWGAHGIVLWVWHVPALYEWAVRNEGVHALQHAMFLATAALFWWGLLYGRYGRVGYGAAVFYVFTTVVHTGLLGAALTLTGVPLYPGYIATSHRHGVDALADQQLAGIIMWVPAGFILTLLGLALFAAWLGESERRAEAWK